MARPRRSALSPASSEAGGETGVAANSAPHSFAVSRSVADMAGEELKNHARKMGVSERDIQGLSESRLRQNCMVMIHEVLDAI